MVKDSALHVNKGIEQPDSINSNFVHRMKGRKKQQTAEFYIKGIENKNLSVLSQAITLIESNHPEHQKKAQTILEHCLPKSGNSVRIGITGVPGVGKSTFIEALGCDLIDNGHKVAVLAVDPSSERSKGSILGDKTRMEKLSTKANGFIRPSPSAGSLGGVARKTRETVLLCEAAGFDTIIIETVGVGQSETMVKSMVDFFLLLMLAGAGDELQGIKRGIMEMADAIAITKTDGDNINRAVLAKTDYQNALHMFPKSETGVTPKVFTCSSMTGNGIKDVWQFIADYKNETSDNGFFSTNRAQQAKFWMHETIQNTIKDRFYNDRAIKQKISEIETAVIENKISSFVAAQELVQLHDQLKAGE